VTLRIRSIEIENFRKFRRATRISGFTDGLNIVIEPNESGKSTMLEALRAAFFIRHSANSKTTRSFRPHSDSVAPRVSVGFEIEGTAWSVTKQFLKSSSIELVGPTGRWQSDEAEEKLQHLLGFERQTGQGMDTEVQGALGLLWVAQATALDLAAPGRIVRDTIRGALQEEVGVIVGGPRFDAVKARISKAYEELRTANGNPTKRLAAAIAAAKQARERREEAERLAAAFEERLAELEISRRRKAVLERDLADPTESERKKQLEAELLIARNARERLSARRAEHSVARNEVDRLIELSTRFEEAVHLVKTTGKSRDAVVRRLAVIAEEWNVAVERERHDREELEKAKSVRQAAAVALDAGRKSADQSARREAYAKAAARREETEKLEAAFTELETLSRAAPSVAALDELEELDRALLHARARLEAGAIRLQIDVHDDTPVTIDGRPAAASVEVTAATTLTVGTYATLRVLPPAGGLASAHADWEMARRGLADALAALGCESLASARAKTDDAKLALQEMKSITLRIEALCPADPIIGLSAGRSALKALEIPATAPEGLDVLDVAALDTELSKANEAWAEREGRHQASGEILREVEQRHQKAAIDNAKASTEATAAEAALAALSRRVSADQVANELTDARRLLALRYKELADAEANASVFDADALERRIANIDKAKAVADRQLVELTTSIARLEGVIETEAPKGLVGEFAEAREEEKLAEAILVRTEAEADMLKLLLDRLRQAYDDASRQFLGPVTRRVATYVRRILPASEPAFGDELGLDRITRAGVEEETLVLSRGTQEQLGVLTRLAFADLLLDRGLPVSLILDDPLVYSDDARLDAMTEILTEAGKRMQIIVLTCRERAFRHLDANRIPLFDGTLV
jgi:hypothetical protein